MIGKNEKGIEDQVLPLLGMEKNNSTRLKMHVKLPAAAFIKTAVEERQVVDIGGMLPGILLEQNPLRE